MTRKPGKPAQPKYTEAQFLNAIPGTQGVISVIARRVGCSRAQVYNMKNTYPAVAQAITDERENMKDFAESTLFTLIKERNITALIFYLKTQARDRGYVERQEVKVETWQDRAVEDIRQGVITYDALVEAFDHNLARELFLMAGVPIEGINNE